ncbi:MAG: hypothetical protein ACC669_03590 [bacterium]
MGPGLNVKADCKRIKSLSSSGEHKASVDSLAALERKDGSCSYSTSRAVKASKSKLEAADSFVRLAMKQKKDGDLTAARGSLEEALEVYPRYYWVKKLLRGVEKSIIAETESLVSEAHYLESVNDWEAARSRLEQAAMLYPEDAEIKAQIGRIDRVIEENRAKAAAEERRSRLKADIDRATEELNAARKAEQDGRLDDSAYHISQALIIIPRNDPLQREIVEYARLLGMKSFSSGRLRQAREVWRLAMAADPDNEKLRKYLHEVEYRIDNLENIQRDRDSVGNR